MIVTGYITYKPLVQRFHFHETIVRQGKGDVQEYEFLELPNSLKTVGEVVTHVKTKLDIDMDLKFCFEKSILRPDLSIEVFRTAKADVFVSPYPLPALSMSFVNEDTGASTSVEESDESKNNETTRSSMYDTLDEETISAVEVSVNAEDESGQSSMKVLEEISVAPSQHVTAQLNSTTMSTKSMSMKRRLSFTDCLLGSSPVSERSPKMLKMSEVEVTPGSGVNVSTLSESTLKNDKYEELNAGIMEISTPGTFIFVKKSVDGTKEPLQECSAISEVESGPVSAIETSDSGLLGQSCIEYARLFDLDEIDDAVIGSDFVDNEEDDTAH